MDVRELLDRAVEAPPADAATVERDLARGRRARRRRSLLGVTGAFAAIAVAGVGVANLVGDPAQDGEVVASDVGAVTDETSGEPGVDEPASEGSAESAAGESAPADDAPIRPDTVMLVAFSGDQPSGYDVQLIPDGWEIQVANPYYMVIAPIGAADQDPASFLGKLLVMLRSVDEQGTPHGTSIAVGDGTGYLNHQPEAAILTYQDAGGTWAQVQVPPALGWSDAQIAEFAGGVTITTSARPSHG